MEPISKTLVLNDSTLRGQRAGKVKRLSGFKKTHRAPDYHNSSTEAFVRKVGTADVKIQADAIHEEIRREFRYKRKDIDYTCDAGVAIIKTPDFDVSVMIEQDTTDSVSYTLTTEVSSIRRQEVVSEDGFSQIFSKYCDTLFIEFLGSIDVDAQIDAIEDVDELREILTYESDGSSLTLKFSLIEFHVTAEGMALSSRSSMDLKALLEHINEVLVTLSDCDITLLESN